MWRYRATCISVARTCAARASLDTKCCPDAVDIHVTVCHNTEKPTNAHQQALQLMQVESRARCTQQFTGRCDAHKSTCRAANWPLVDPAHPQFEAEEQACLCGARQRGARAGLVLHHHQPPRRRLVAAGR